MYIFKFVSRTSTLKEVMEIFLPIGGVGKLILKKKKKKKTHNFFTLKINCFKFKKVG
jgi:hypothetical protein